MSEYKPGTYVKNGVTRHAGSAAEAVALEFQGYARTAEVAASEADVQGPETSTETNDTDTGAPAEVNKTEVTPADVAPKPAPPIKTKD